jgi:protein-S-isoprenylcysteine O-methyltransferase Ste14
MRAHIRSTTRPGQAWVTAQIPLLAASLAWPVIQHLLPVGSMWPSILLWPGRVTGAGAVLVAVGLFRAAKRELGSDLVASPVPRSGAHLHSAGIYRQIRHPIYSAIILGTVGWSMLCTSVVGLALGGACTIFFLFKTVAEERYLRRRYHSYEEYASRVPRYIPRLRRKTLV